MLRTAVHTPIVCHGLHTCNVRRAAACPSSAARPAPRRGLKSNACRLACNLLQPVLRSWRHCLPSSAGCWRSMRSGARSACSACSQRCESLACWVVWGGTAVAGVHALNPHAAVELCVRSGRCAGEAGCGSGGGTRARLLAAVFMACRFGALPPAALAPGPCCSGSRTGGCGGEEQGQHVAIPGTFLSNCSICCVPTAQLIVCPFNCTAGL